MQLQVAPGRYIVAVSGGVDSMVLLDRLLKLNNFDLIIAHFDHGMRQESVMDEALVAETTARHGLIYKTERAELGAGASEAAARMARYDFLFRLKAQFDADAIITAHHQDDLLETMVLNVLRGTGRLGLSPLQSRPEIMRPMLSVSKQTILAYAHEHNIAWREDHTNRDVTYKRNWVRHTIIPKLQPSQRQYLVDMADRMRVVNQSMQMLLNECTSDELNRDWFRALPEDVAREVMANWLRKHDISDFTGQTIIRTVRQARTLTTNKRIDVLHKREILIGRNTLALRRLER